MPTAEPRWTSTMSRRSPQPVAKQLAACLQHNAIGQLHTIIKHRHTLSYWRRWTSKSYLEVKPHRQMQEASPVHCRFRGCVGGVRLCFKKIKKHVLSSLYRRMRAAHLRVASSDLCSAAYGGCQAVTYLKWDNSQDMYCNNAFILISNSIIIACFYILLL